MTVLDRPFLITRSHILSMICLLVLTSSTATAQRELLPPSHPVYKFLLRQELRGVIEDFHWGMLPLSRRDVAKFLVSMNEERSRLSSVDLQKLDDFSIEFEYDISKTLTNASTVLPGFSLASILDNERQKYIIAYEDSSASFFFDGFGSYSYRIASGDSVGAPFISLLEGGFRFRGTLFNRLGFFLQASDGRRLSGDPNFGNLENRLKVNTQFRDTKKYFDFTTGYLQYDADWLRVTLGREQVFWGSGFSERMIFSDNTIPFDFGKIDLTYKSVHYSFLHASLVGTDTLGRALSSKYIAAHRLEFNLFPRLRLGLSEMLLYGNQPVNFTYLNPLIFLTSADLSSDPSNKNNSIIGIDFEALPTKDVRVHGTLIIDDIDFGTLGDIGKNVSGNNNKFAWQFGVEWTDALGLSNFSLNGEYMRIGPFVYSHRSLVNQFTHKDLSLGPDLQPNSDQWLLGFDFDITYRLTFSGEIRFQRTGENILNSNGRIVFNAGSDILRGDGDTQHPNAFLEGHRVNRTLATLAIQWQPIKQYFIEVKYFHRTFDFPVEGRNLKDSILWTTVRVDY